MQASDVAYWLIPTILGVLILPTAFLWLRERYAADKVPFIRDDAEREAENEFDVSLLKLLGIMQETEPSSGARSDVSPIEAAACAQYIQQVLFHLSKDARRLGLLKVQTASNHPTGGTVQIIITIRYAHAHRFKYNGVSVSHKIEMTRSNIASVVSKLFVGDLIKIA